ncbi:MAG: ATP-binding cassette domain-containing protein [Planctomycetota bacterium]
MIEAKELTMYYGDFLAVDKASFRIETGEVVGLLGPNGAGKTTVMKMLTTYLHPTRGTALVGGHDVVADPLAVRKVIGYLPESLPLYPGMEVREYLRFVGSARGIGGTTLRDRLEWVRERCGLRRVYRQPIAELSKGYRQRTGLAQALIHDPEIVILDEPTSGLDPHQIIEIRNLIGELGKERTVVISTHILQEMEALTDRFIIIDRGRIVADGTLGALCDRAMDCGRLWLAVTAPQAEVVTEVRRISVVLDIAGDDAGTLVRYKKGANLIADLQRLASDKNWQVREIREVPYSLEEVFLALTRSESDAVSAAAPAAVTEGA